MNVTEPLLYALCLILGWGFGWWCSWVYFGGRDQ